MRIISLSEAWKQADDIMRLAEQGRIEASIKEAEEYDRMFEAVDPAK